MIDKKTKTKSKITKPRGIRKKAEYEELLDLIRSGVPIESWKNIAIALDINEETMVRWKKEPEIQSAIKEQIKVAIQAMKVYGKEDWKMWDRYAKLLGVDVPEKIDLTSNGKTVFGWQE